MLKRPARAMATPLRESRPVMIHRSPPGSYAYQIGTASGARPPSVAFTATVATCGSARNCSRSSRVRATAGTPPIAVVVASGRIIRRNTGPAADGHTGRRAAVRAAGGFRTRGAPGRRTPLVYLCVHHGGGAGHGSGQVRTAEGRDRPGRGGDHRRLPRLAGSRAARSAAGAQ